MAREPDVRPVAPAWRDLEGLVEGARRRGFTDAHVDGG
jgi:hypothetical protein